jgi:serine/threonine-protein kinase
MGTVWAARHELLGRDFALKFARVPSKADPAVRARFQREAQLIGKLRHPNIVDVTDFGEVSPNGDFFLAMELLEGESLADRIKHHGHLESYESVTITADVARGLAAVHDVGVVHRDVKPENIFLARSPTGSIVPKLLDFGISKEWGDSLATQQGTLTGTPAYMSPEQANGETKLGPHTDIWSLGVVLYEMLTGKHPFVEQNYQALMTAIAERPYVPLGETVPTAVCRIVGRCLQKQPNDRYVTSNDMAEALLSLGAQPSTITQRSETQTQRRKRALLLALLPALLLIAVVAYSLSNQHLPTDTNAVPTSSIANGPSPDASAITLTVPPLPTATSSSVTLSASAQASTTSQQMTRPPQRPHDKRATTSVTTPGF